MASVTYGKCIMANVVMANIFMAKILWQMKLSHLSASVAQEVIVSPTNYSCFAVNYDFNCSLNLGSQNQA